LPFRNTNNKSTIRNSSHLTMKIITPAALALASTPLTTDAWSIGGPYFTKQIYLPSPNTMMRRQRALSNRFFQETQLASPRYELVDNDEKFQLSVDVPGVKMEDINVCLEDGYLTVSGQRLSSNENSRFTSKFSQTFSLDEAVDVDKFTASMTDGVLVVAAPKDMKRIEENITKIPVVQGKREVTVKDKAKTETQTVEDTVKAETESQIDEDDAAAEKLDLDQAVDFKDSADHDAHNEAE